MKTLKFAFAILMMAACMTSCKNNQAKETTEQEEPQGPDYAAIVEKEFPTIDEFANIVDAFQQGTRQLLPTGDVWDNNEQAFRAIAEPKGYEVVRFDDFGYSITALKNCTEDPESGELQPVNADSLSAVICFTPMGDMYVLGQIQVFDENIFGALVQKVQDAGYKLDENREYKEEGCDYYVKDYYTFICNKTNMTLKLDFDFMNAQMNGAY